MAVYVVLSYNELNDTEHVVVVYHTTRSAPVTDLRNLRALVENLLTTGALSVSKDNIRYHASYATCVGTEGLQLTPLFPPEG